MIALTLSLVLALGQTQVVSYFPYDPGNPMSFGATTEGLISSRGDFKDVATVSDMDIERELAPGTAQREFGNSHVSISQTIRSGSLMGPADHAFTAPTGMHTWKFTSRALTNDTDQTIYRLDSFSGTDTAGNPVQDRPTGEFTVLVGIPGTKSATTPPTKGG